jgi:hypothetical protein
MGYVVWHEQHLALIEQAMERHCHWHLNYKTVDCYPGVKLEREERGHSCPQFNNRRRSREGYEDADKSVRAPLSQA